MSHEGRPTDRALALAAALLGVVLWYGAGAIDAGPGYDRIGPRVFPYAVSAGAMTIACLLAWSAWRGQDARRPPLIDEAFDWRPLVPLVVALVLYVPLVERLGFIVASGAQFAGVAWSLGSRRPGRDLAVGSLLALTVYLAFSKGLGLDPPAGVLEGWL